MEQSRPSPATQLWFYLVACSLGIAMRVLYPADTAWLNDQKWNFQHGSTIGGTEPWTWIGMESGGGVRNPGMSIWCFVGLIRVFHVSSPEQLSIIVSLLSITALLLLGMYALWGMEGGDRNDWLGAGAIAAVNPTAIWLDRVIWCQSLLPLPMTIFWIGVWNRKRWWGAFLWGAIGACLGQIHMAGFFAEAAVFLWIFLFRPRAVCWWAFATGTLLASWPLIPWIRYLLGGHYHRQAWSFWTHPPGKVWAWWLIADSGLATKYEAFNFWRRPFIAFLKQPLIKGHPTFFMLFVHVLLLVVLVVALYTSARQLFSWREDWRMNFIFGKSETGFLLRASVIGFAGLLTLLPAPVFVHYFLAVFPMGFIWLVRILRAGTPRAVGGENRLLMVVAVLQLAISITAAIYVHQNFGADRGSFGIRLPVRNN